MRLKSIRENLVRRMSVNYIAYLGQATDYPKNATQDWCAGYFQAKKDVENFLKQLEIYEPFEEEEEEEEEGEKNNK